MEGLDELDMQILKGLTEDGRIPYRILAKKLGRSYSIVYLRMTTLREKGVIKRFTIEIDEKQKMKQELISKSKEELIELIVEGKGNERKER